jgi:prepilin-type N-terminal cleavage/methylation domain-containing protein
VFDRQLDGRGREAVKISRTDAGFTLLELLVVVLIIGILVAIAIPIFNGVKSDAQRKTCWANQRTIEGSVELYRTATGSLPAAGVIGASHVLITAEYIKAVPTCPLTAADYELDASGSIAIASLTCAHGHY